MTTHATDTACTIDPATDCCIDCGTLHGDPCPACQGRGFHRPGCVEWFTATEHGDITHPCGAEFTCSIPYEPRDKGAGGGFYFDGVTEGDATEDGSDVVCICGAVIPEAAIVEAVEAARVEAEDRW